MLRFHLDEGGTLTDIMNCMPTVNIVKPYVEKGYYHIYNRGVEKRDIFLDEQDCIVFQHYLKLYLSPVGELIQLQSHQPSMRIHRFIPLNLSQEIDLLTFSLMPNHFHLQIKQYTKDGIVKFMRRLSTSYVMYFNKKYKRIGGLFQSSYKGVLIDSDSYLIHLSRYIHLNPSKTSTQTVNFKDFSSYQYYLGKKNASWLKPQEILDYFKNAQRTNLKDFFSYQNFVEDYQTDSEEILGNLILEN